MKMRYDHEDDVLMIWLAHNKQIDHTEQINTTILHLSENDESILLEILNACEFIVELVRTAIASSALIDHKESA